MEYQILCKGMGKTALFIEDTMSVGEVRAVVGAMLDVPETHTVTLTYNGKLLRRDDELWSSVVGTTSTAASASDTTRSAVLRKVYCSIVPKVDTDVATLQGEQLAAMQRQLAKDEEKASRQKASMMEPMIDAMVSNPSFMEMMMNTSPQMKQMVEKHPELSSQINPELMKMMIMAQIDPDYRREMSRSMDLQLAQLSAIPGAEQLLAAHTKSLVRDLENTSARSASDLHPASEEHARPEPGKTANDQALPNPWQQQQHQQQAAATQVPALAAPSSGLPFFPGLTQSAANNPFAALLANSSAAMSGGGASRGGNLFGTHGGSAASLAAAAASTMHGSNAAAQPVPRAVQDEQHFASQLQLLADMGFEDRALCLEALRATNGDVEAAVGFIAARQDAQDGARHNP